MKKPEHITFHVILRVILNVFTYFLLSYFYWPIQALADWWAFTILKIYTPGRADKV